MNKSRFDPIPYKAVLVEDPSQGVFIELSVNYSEEKKEFYGIHIKFECERYSDFWDSDEFIISFYKYLTGQSRETEHEELILETLMELGEYVFPLIEAYDTAIRFGLFQGRLKESNRSRSTIELQVKLNKDIEEIERQLELIKKLRDKLGLSE